MSRAHLPQVSGCTDEEFPIRVQKYPSFAFLSTLHYPSTGSQNIPHFHQQAGLFLLETKEYLLLDTKYIYFSHILRHPLEAWSPENLSGSLLRKVYYATVRIQKSLLCHGTDSETAPELRPSDTNYGGCDRNYQSPSLMSSRKSRARCSRLNQCFLAIRKKGRTSGKVFSLTIICNSQAAENFTEMLEKFFQQVCGEEACSQYAIWQHTTNTNTQRQTNKYINIQIHKFEEGKRPVPNIRYDLQMEYWSPRVQFGCISNREMVVYDLHWVQI